MPKASLHLLACCEVLFCGFCFLVEFEHEQSPKIRKNDTGQGATLVYDPTLAKKTLNRTEPTHPESHKDSEDKMPLQHLCNEEVNEDEFISPTGALDQYLFRNLPDASMQLGQERHRREVCSSKLQEIERELQEFSDAFGSKLQELKKSMGEFAQSMKELMHYDEGTYIEDRLWEEADTNSKAVDTVTSTQSPPHR